MDFSVFVVFHCNLAFSAVEKNDRIKIIERCYWPMLELAEKGIPIGVEATGWTLEQIFHLQPQWLDRLRSLIGSGKAEMIGSGYAQLIGPLVPWMVNLRNQTLGQLVYEQFTGAHARLALVNEQAWATGIGEAYRLAKYETVFMEWDNSFLSHSEWPLKWRYAPQRLRNGMKLLWNQSEIFQQLQRHVHDELELDDYLSYMGKHFSLNEGVLCLYGNDAEIFNFRPGRFETEAKLSTGEWQKLFLALEAVKNKYHVDYCLPSEAAAKKFPFGNKTLELASPERPIIVKKQPKYNILRWAVTGRDDARINARCHGLAKYLHQSDPAGADVKKWKKLCALWGSDYRTHITGDRWKNYLVELENTEKAWLGATNDVFKSASPTFTVASAHPDRCAKLINLNTAQACVQLNRQKGLSIKSAVFPQVWPDFLFGTLAHGYFENIDLAADFFSGHTILEIPGEKKFTDLCETVPEFEETNDFVAVQTSIRNFYCPMVKKIEVSKKEPILKIDYVFSWTELPRGSLRLLFLTLNPLAFNMDSLFYATTNGGNVEEKFMLTDYVEHGAPVSSAVSASCALGMSEGYVLIGDSKKNLQIRVDQAQSYTVGMIHFRKVESSFLARVILTARELDETLKPVTESHVQTISVVVKASLT